MPTEKGRSCANLHTEEKMPNTILGMFGSDTSLQQKIYVTSQISTPKKNSPGTTASSTAAWPVTGHSNKRTMTWFSFLPLAHTIQEHLYQMKVKQNSVRLKIEIIRFPRHLDIERSQN